MYGPCTARSHEHVNDNKEIAVLMNTYLCIAAVAERNFAHTRQVRCDLTHPVTVLCGAVQLFESHGQPVLALFLKNKSSKTEQ